MKCSIDIQVDQKLTETQKNKLFIELGKAVSEAIGPVEFGSIFIYSEK